MQNPNHSNSSFEKILSLSDDEIEFDLRGQPDLTWCSFYLNPRRLRGSDFLMRWSQGQWSEHRIVDAINHTSEFIALPYGPSGTAPDDDIRKFELYFERLDSAGLGDMKRPDLLLFKKSGEIAIYKLVSELGGITELPFIPEKNPIMKELLKKAIIAIECENSLWIAEKMPDYGASLKPMKRMGGKIGLTKTAVVPTIIIKDEDRIPLKKWQAENGVKIHIWHSFFDLTFGISLDNAEKLFKDGLILPTEQVFQAPGGATTTKTIYKIYYHYAYPVAKSVEAPNLIAAHIIDKNGHILPYVKFEKGKIKIESDAIKLLRQI